MNDRIKPASGKIVLPKLKGHCKLTLHNPTTGKNEIVEKDNLITNAVVDMLCSNYNGQGNFSKLLPLKNMFSGVMCFEDEVQSVATNYFPPNDDVNKLIAHAGDEAHSTASTLRGNPNTVEMISTDSAQKFVWDFSTSVGNGQISAVCLCPGQFGNIGTKPFDASGNPIQVVNTPNSNDKENPPFTRAYCIQHPFEVDFNTGIGKALYIGSGTVEEITVKHELYKFGIMRGASDFTEISSRGPLSLANLPGTASFTFFFDENYYYFAQATTGTNLRLWTINRSTWVSNVDNLTITDASLYNSTSNAIFGYFRTFPHFVFEGGYLYWPKSTLDAFYKIKISDGSYTEIPGATSTSGLQLRPVKVSAGLWLGQDYILNNDHIYSIAESDKLFRTDGGTINYSGANNYGRNYLQNGTPALWANEAGNYDNGNGVVINTMFLSTICDLDTAVVKTSAQAMKIEYTVTEVTGS